jgi:hypothetical protein
MRFRFPAFRVTFRRVFMPIDPEAFERAFVPWVQSFAASFKRKFVAIDGKVVRRSFDRGRDQGPLHFVSAWAWEQGSRPCSAG